MKKVFKFTVLVITATISFMIVSVLIPYSEGLKAANHDADSSALLFILLSNAWLCFAIWYVVVKSPWSRARLALSLTGVLFLVSSFMTQIETVFFHAAFPLLAIADIFWIFIANGVPIFVGVPLALYLYRTEDDRQNADQSISIPPLRELAPGLAIIGFAYVFLYFVFGYFVAWQAEDLRVFYSGSAVDAGFFPQLMYNLNEYPAIYPFQFLRGILFGAFILPLVMMFKTNPRSLFISMLLVFLTTGVSLIIPNALFPDSVRWAHFVEMISSMFVFTLIVWYVYTRLSISGGRQEVESKRNLVSEA